MLRLHELCRGNPDVLAWLREHDLDPMRVACGETEGPFIDGDQLTVHLYSVDASGHRYIAPGGSIEVATEPRTITLMRPPPDLHLSDGRPFSATVPA